jgi:hypothetical protein
MTLGTELTNDTANSKPTNGPILSQFSSLNNLTTYIVQTYLNTILLPPCGAIQIYHIHVHISPLSPTHNIHIQQEQAHPHKVYLYVILFIRYLSHSHLCLFNLLMIVISNARNVCCPIVLPDIMKYKKQAKYSFM